MSLPLNATNEQIEEHLSEYCECCNRMIKPSNVEEVFTGVHDGFIFVHDNVPHHENFDTGKVH